MTLFRQTTGEDWYKIMYDLTRDKSYGCSDDTNSCGNCNFFILKFLMLFSLLFLFLFNAILCFNYLLWCLWTLLKKIILMLKIQLQILKSSLRNLKKNGLFIQQIN